MRIALAQINPTVGDIDGNSRLIRRDLERARRQGAQLVVFPELSIIGYPPKDLLLKPLAIEQSAHAVREIAAECRGIAAIVGYPAPARGPRGRTLHNAAALCHEGKVVHQYVKRLLPTYDVFDEHRYFEPGATGSDELAEFQGLRLGVSICEDLWNDREVVPRQLYHEDPIGRLAALGAQVLVNCAASPFVMGKHTFRMRLFTSAARRYRLPVLYCNQVGGNDELVFDGQSSVVDAGGKLVAQAKAFEEDLLLVDLPDDPAGPVTRGRIEPAPDALPAAYQALVLGLGDYCRKCGFKQAVLGLSGGIDSALTAALCVAALGRDNVRGIAMPSRYSSEGSVRDARALAARLGIAFHLIPIAGPHETLETLLTPHFEGRPPDATEENMQARVRGIVLMAFSNKFGSLLVTTGNKSELAVGYCTLYGDMAGGLAILSDVPKTLVWKLARWINDAPDSPLRREYGGPVIPESSITKPPSAELRPDQTDQDSLPPYEVLDEIVERYVEGDESTRQIIRETGFAEETVRRIVRLIDLNEYKRKQAAPGLKITGRAFGFGRRMPIAQRFDHSRAVDVVENAPA